LNGGSCIKVIEQRLTVLESSPASYVEDEVNHLQNLAAKLNQPTIQQSPTNNPPLLLSL